MAEICSLKGREILDSRGNPTVEAEIKLTSGLTAIASVPSGASKGHKESYELRDADSRYSGQGVLKAIGNINCEIASAIIGQHCLDQAKLDSLLINLDGTKNKSRLGSNAILAVSIAIAKAAALSLKIPLYQYLGTGNKMPLPMINIINGGAHANNNLDIQEFMIMPVSAANIKEAVRMGSEVFHSLKFLLNQKGYSTCVGDEGGFAPNLKSASHALDFITKAIEIADLVPGKDIFIALDIAASGFYHQSYYLLKEFTKKCSIEDIVLYYQKLITDFPIISIEDPIAEEDTEGWKIITQEIGDKVQLVGDDIFVTNKEIFSQGIKQNYANSILIKPNQIGTITETLEVIKMAQINHYNTIVSHRSGETEDTTIAHIAVGSNAKQIKTGSICRSERTAKYNELIRIEESLLTDASFAGDVPIKKYLSNRSLIDII